MASEHVLDDALDDFSLATTLPKLPVDRQAAPVGLGTSSKLPQRPGDAAGPSSSSGPSLQQQPAPPAAYDPLGKASACSTTPAAAFDPLRKRKSKQAGQKKGKAPAQNATSQASSIAAPSAPSAAQTTAASQPQPATAAAAAGDGGQGGNAINEDLARGVAQLMADLAKADAAGSGGGGEAPDQASLPHEREIASTLAALAAAVPARSGGDADAHGGAQDAMASMAERLAQQLGGAGGNAGADSDESFASLADSIMQQLLSKDVLYQPMKDIGAKYPEWLAQRRETLPQEEVARYEAQYRYIRQICSLYEEDPGNFNRLFSLIQQMQACGQPPEEIVQDLAPGLAFGADGLPQLPTGAGDNCVIA